jgi:hypothetical protein
VLATAVVVLQAVARPEVIVFQPALAGEIFVEDRRDVATVDQAGSRESVFGRHEDLVSD